MNKGGLIAAGEASQHRILTVVTKTAKTMRDEILLLAEEGVYLGSEEQLMARLKVSRNTFRQAIKLLEHEELVTIRRGVGGGFFTRKPSAEAVAHMAAIYLLFQRTPTIDVLRVAAVLRKEAVNKIIASNDKKVRSAPKEFLIANEGFYGWSDRRKAIRVVNGFHSLLASLSGNTALALFMDVIPVFGSRSESLTFTQRRLQEYGEIIADLADAIERGDAKKADKLWDKECEATLAWFNKSRES